MIESCQETTSSAPSARAIEFSDDTFVVDSTLIGELLRLLASRVLMRAGRITSAYERWIDEHTGEFHLSFFDGNHRARLSMDADGRVLRKSVIVGDRPIPNKPHRQFALDKETPNQALQSGERR